MSVSKFRRGEHAANPHFYAHLYALDAGRRWRYQADNVKPLQLELVELPDGRLAALYRDTVDGDARDAAYWRRTQRSRKLRAAVRRAKVETIIVDVTGSVPLKSRRGEGFDSYTQRIVDDIGRRPDRYFQRREIVVG